LVSPLAIRPLCGRGRDGDLGDGAVAVGLVGLAYLVRVSTIAIAAVLSGFEAENVAADLRRRGVGLRRWPWGRCLEERSS
jgi:hypothetical protein